jgi:hypothetical protein
LTWYLGNFYNFLGGGDRNVGISILFLKNWICGYGIVFIDASDYALNMGWWGMGGVLSCAFVALKAE